MKKYIKRTPQQQLRQLRKDLAALHGQVADLHQLRTYDAQLLDRERTKVKELEMQLKQRVHPVIGDIAKALCQSNEALSRAIGAVQGY